MFSPIVSAPLTWWSGICFGASALYCSMSDRVRFSNACRSAAVHQSVSRPSPSNLEPWSSKPWPISWPMTAPIAP